MERWDSIDAFWPAWPKEMGWTGSRLGAEWKHLETPESAKEEVFEIFCRHFVLILFILKFRNIQFIFEIVTVFCNDFQNFSYFL